MEVKVIGQMDNSIDHTFESANRVYDVRGLAPTINTCGGGGLQPKILESVNELGFMDNGTGKHQSNTVYGTDGICPTQRANKVCCGVIEVMAENNIKRFGNLYGEDKGTSYTGNVYDKDHLSHALNTMQGGNRQPMIVEANSIRMVRTEEGKALRKQYENHKIHHGFNEHREPELRKDGVTNTLSTVQKDNYICVAMRGRNPTNPSDRTSGTKLEQTLEVNQNGTTNCLTSVQKDNLVIEKVRIKQATKQGYIECEVGGVADLSFPDSKSRRGRVIENGQVSPTLMAGEQDICRIEMLEQYYLSEKGKKYVCDPKRGMCTDINADICQPLTAKGQSNWTGTFVSPDIDSLEKNTSIGSTEPTLIHLKDGTTITSDDSLIKYRIRKLTPKECWRLMDFSDEDFEKAAEVNSNTQLYKQAGNSIVVNVLAAILGQLLPGKENIYKELS